MKTLLGYFWRGCLVLLPLAGTIYIAYVVFTSIDRILPIGIPGLGFVLTVAIVTLVGALTSNVVGRAVLDMTEAWFTKLPLVRLVYSSIHDLIDAFVGDKKRFDRPVAVALIPGSTCKALGFVTRDTLEKLGMTDQVAVYFPQSYNFAGNLLIVPRSQLERLDVSSTDLMTFIVSGGVSGLGVAQQPRGPKSTRTILGIGPTEHG
jgi:uncharacterized membrane protein